MNNFQLCHYLISSKLSLNRSFYIFRSKEKRRKKSDKLFKNQNCRIRLDFFLSPFHSLKPIVPHIFRSKETSSKPQNRLLRFHLFSITISRALTFDLPHTSRTQDNETYIAPPPLNYAVNNIAPPQGNTHETDSWALSAIDTLQSTFLPRSKGKRGPRTIPRR